MKDMYDFQLNKMAARLVMACLVCTFPVISPLSSVAYRMKEELPVGTVIGSVKNDAALADEFSPEDVNRLVFSILTPVDGSATDWNYFQIGESSGILSVMKPLDRDRDDVCAFRRQCVMAFDVAVGPEDIFRVISIQIEVEDVNDNSPAFGISEIDLSISELASIGSSYQLPAVVDPDGDRYGVTKMSVSPASGQFTIKWKRNSDGRVDSRLELLERLDRETVNTFDLTITASDGGLPSRSAILLVHVDVLDANDNVPQFQEARYEARIPEDARVGATLVQVQAEDADYGNNGEVTYRLEASTREQYGHLFDISETMGEITLIGKLDREAQDVYYLSVVASDGGDDSREASATVAVFVDDINDNAPAIRIDTLTESEAANVLESSPIGTFVALLTVKDPDWGRNADVACTLNSGNFRLEALQPNQFKVVTGVRVDREERRSYTLEVFCRDGGLPQKSTAAMIAVQVDDVNDNPPVFASDDITIHVTENSRPGTVIGQLAASDADDGENGRVTYSTTDTFNTHISVAQSTGVITTIASIDREATERFVIYVIARDHGEPALSSTATVTVIVDDVNDMVPAFSSASYTFVVTENARGRHELGRLTATDRDNPPYNAIQYDIRGQDAYFLEIDPENGTLYTVKPLDRETTPVIRVQALATDMDNPEFIGVANVSVYVSDVNDHTPRITFPSPGNNTIQISGHLRAGDVVGTIRATDGDTGQNAVLEYFLAFPRRAGEGVFAVDRSSGSITVRGELSAVDRELVHCTAVVKDGGIPSLVASANFTIVINLTLPAPEAMVGGQALNMNVTIVIVVVATTLVLVAVLTGAIVLVFRKMRRRRDNKPRYSIEKMGELVPNNGQLDIERQQRRDGKEGHHEMKSVVKVLGTPRCKDADRESLGSGEGSTTDSGRGASEEGEHGEHDRSIMSRHNDSTDCKMDPDDNAAERHTDSNSSLDRQGTMPKRNSKNKNVTFEEDVRINELTPEKDIGYSTPYNSCPAITTHSPANVSYTSLEGWSPDGSTRQYSTPIPQSTPRRTVRNVKAKDRCKKLDCLTGSSDCGQIIQSEPNICTHYNQNKRPYDFADSNSLLRYKGQGTDDSTSEITSAASTTSGSYIIESDDHQCNC